MSMSENGITLEQPAEGVTRILLDRPDVLNALSPEMVVAFINPQWDRLVEYANHAPHARFVARELVPELTAELPLVESAAGRTLMGSSFGGVADPGGMGRRMGRPKRASASLMRGKDVHRPRGDARAPRGGRSLARGPFPRGGGPVAVTGSAPPKLQAAAPAPLSPIV